MAYEVVDGTGMIGEFFGNGSDKNQAAIAPYVLSSS